MGDVISVIFCSSLMIITKECPGNIRVWTRMAWSTHCWSQGKHALGISSCLIVQIMESESLVSKQLSPLSECHKKHITLRNSASLLIHCDILSTL